MDLSFLDNAPVVPKYSSSPELQEAIIQVESGGNPKAIGPSIPKYKGTEDEHALGLGQFLPSTARQYGIDPLNEDDARKGVSRHLDHLMNKFDGDQDKAI